MLRLIRSVRSNRVFVISCTCLIITTCLPQWYLSTHANNLAVSSAGDFHNFVIAKNLAFFGRWGMSKYNFWPAASSLVYPFALAIPFFIVGAQLWVSWLVNGVFAALILRRLEGNLAALGMNEKSQTLIICGAIWLTSMPIMVLYGSEQILLLFFLLQLLIHVQNEWALVKFTKAVYIYAALLVAARFESLIIVACISSVLAIYGKSRQALLLLLASMIPILLFGSLAVRQGGAFIDSMIVFGTDHSYLHYYWIVGALITFTIPYLLRMKTNGVSKIVPTILILLLTLGNVACTHELKSNQKEEPDLTWQTGKFVHLYYYKYPLAIQGQPFVPWLSEGRKVDLERIGLQSVTDSIAAKTKAAHTGIAIVSDQYEYLLPLKWKKIALWQEKNTHTGKMDQTFFFSADTFYTQKLFSNLFAFQTSLPKAISVTYFFP